MARPRRINARTILGGAIALMVILTLMPPSVLAFLRPLHDLAETVVSPIQGPLHRAWQWARGGPSDVPADAEWERLKTESDERLREILAVRQENDDLRRMIAELQSGRQVQVSQAVSLLMASVIGRSDATSLDLKLKAGADDGVDTSTVGAVRGVHLVGRIVRVLDDVSFVRPITDPSSEAIKGVVMLNETTRGEVCILEAQGDGTLRGPVGEKTLPPEAGAAEILVGMMVRLSDEYWPASAQMLVVGRIENVEPLESFPLRKVITVRPVLDLTRLGQVMLRIPDSGASGADKGARG